MLLGLAGCVVRLWLGMRAELWATAPDQLAWGILLSEASEGLLRWDMLIHYPHEGGTLIVSLMALALGQGPLGIPALSWVAFFIESITRTGMIFIAWRSLGFRTAVLFATWSVFAVPSLLPWATVNFGLHAPAAFWPFAALWVISRGAPAARESVGLGVVTGLGLSFSYDALMLVPSTCVLLLVSHRGSKGVRLCATYLAVTAVVLSPHLATRVWLDAGFDLVDGGVVSVRDLEFTAPPVDELATNTWLTVTRTLPGSSLLPGMGRISPGFTRLVWGIVLGLGLASAAWYGRKQRVVFFGLLISCTWVLLYAASPAFVGAIGGQSYVVYRHFAAILPLLASLALYPAAKGPRLTGVTAALLVLFGVWGGTSALVRATPPESANVKAAGWILGRKLGHDPARLERLLDHVAERDRPDLAFGYGWGIATAVLAPASPPASAEQRRAAELVLVFSPTVRPRVVEGVGFAFSDGVTPRIRWAPPSGWLRGLKIE